jgi:hypothetical protein
MTIVNTRKRVQFIWSCTKEKSSTKRSSRTPRRGPTLRTYMEKIKNMRRGGVALRKGHRKHHHNIKEF